MFLHLKLAFHPFLPLLTRRFELARSSIHFHAQCPVITPVRCIFPQGSRLCGGLTINCMNISGNSTCLMSSTSESKIGISQKVVNGLCPEGSYCPEGAKLPIHCPQGTFLAKSSSSYPGRYICDCASCGSGYTCSVGSSKPMLCPPGYFCPEQVRVGSMECSNDSPCGNFTNVQICPPGTYQSLWGQKSFASCLKCGNNFSLNNLTGYYCPNPGSFRQNLCPAGYFCVSGDPIAYQCRPGTYRSSPGGLDNISCAMCRGGSYCPTGSVLPLSCPPGKYCGGGSEYPSDCPDGFFCPPNSTVPTNCPPGTFCSNSTEIPVVCPAGTYCPSQTKIPILCPLGTFADSNSTVNRTDIESSCQNCPRGYFGADLLRLNCEKCFRGYLCFGSSNTRVFGTTKGNPLDLAIDGGEICPVGNFCPEGSYVPSPCSRGTYNSNFGSYNISNCTLCPANNFNNLTGQSGCRPCGGTSYSSDDRTFCQCKGRNRVFHASDSACRCLPGYVIFDSSGNPTADGYLDGVLDCELRSLDRCDPGDIRGQDGVCIQSCDDSLCALPPCYCRKGSDQDYCNGTCPSFQVSQAQKIQVGFN